MILFRIINSLWIITFLSILLCNCNHSDKDSISNSDVYDQLMASSSNELTRIEFLQLLQEFHTRHRNSQLSDLDKEPTFKQYFKCQFNKEYTKSLLLLHKQGKPSSGYILPELNVELGRTCSDNIRITDLPQLDLEF